MKFEFARVTRPIRLADYTEELGDAEIRVWVNVPRLVIEHIRDFGTMTNEEVFAWLENLWNGNCQSPASSPQDEDWPIEDIKALFEHCQEKDPALWRWLMDQTIEKLFEYRTGIKKV